MRPDSPHHTSSEMTEMEESFERDVLANVLDRGPSIDRATLDRCREVERQLAAVGIKLGGYRLEPALGGTAIPPYQQPLTTQANS